MTPWVPRLQLDHLRACSSQPRMRCVGTVDLTSVMTGCALYTRCFEGAEGPTTTTVCVCCNAWTKNRSKCQPCVAVCPRGIAVATLGPAASKPNLRSTACRSHRTIASACGAPGRFGLPEERKRGESQLIQSLNADRYDPISSGSWIAALGVEIVPTSS